MTGGEFHYREGELHCEEVKLSQLAAWHGTPAYIYSREAIRKRFRAYRSAMAGLRHRVCFSVKANSNLAVLATLGAEGAGFDIVSGGELYRVLAAGCSAGSVVFSGVGKTAAEIRYALQEGIHSFNCESEAEIHLISGIAVEAGGTASIALRVNPDVNAVTHPYISTGLREHKFGIEMEAAEGLYVTASQLPGIRVEGVTCHIGSQLLDIDPMLEAAEKVMALAERLGRRGLAMRQIDLGGGLGVAYRSGEHSAEPSELISRLRARIERLDAELLVEPGRSIVAEAGVLLTRVLLVKQNGGKTFVIVDAAMNDLIRPSLYQAHHEIVPVIERQGSGEIQADIVGPVCETGDFFARNRQIAAVEAGDLLAICTAGAYGFVLSSNYNSRPRPCELLVDGGEVHVARARESYADLVRGEAPLPPRV